MCCYRSYVQIPTAYIWPIKRIHPGILDLRVPAESIDESETFPYCLAFHVPTLSTLVSGNGIAFLNVTARFQL